MKDSNRKICGLVAALVWIAAPVHAETTTTTLDVQANLIEFCSVNVTDAVDFGDFSDADTSITDGFAVDILCSTSGTLSADAGLHYGGTSGSLRRVQSNADATSFVAYTLAIDGSPWGDASFTIGDPPLFGAGPGPVAGTAELLPANANSTFDASVALGTFSDTVTVTFSY